MSAHQQDRPAQPDPTGPAGPPHLWGADELDALLADQGDASLLGQLVAAAGAPVEADGLVGEEAALTAYRLALAASSAPESRFLTRMSSRAAAAALAGGLVLSGGAAAAATGALPDPVQKTTKGVLAKVGVHVPGPSAHANEHARQHGKSTATPQGSEHVGTGNAVSDLAHSITATGVDKGALISSLASGGQSRAGQHSLATITPTPGETKRPHKHQTGDAARTPSSRATPPTPGSSATR